MVACFEFVGATEQARPLDVTCMHVNTRTRTPSWPIILNLHLQASVLFQQPRGIFDGQHRIFAASKLLAPAGRAYTDTHVTVADKSMPPLYNDFDLLVEVYPVECEKDITALYLEVRM
jgi:hypothetical protein